MHVCFSVLIWNFCTRGLKRFESFSYFSVMLFKMRSLSEKLGTSPKGLACLIGGFILCLSFASDFSYPNINSYLTSYMRTNGYNPNLTYADFIFLSTTKTVVQGRDDFLLLLSKNVQEPIIRAEYAFHWKFGQENRS